MTGWLKAPVPVYDQDAGIEVGTQPRGRAIVTNPVAVGAAGATVVLGAEAAAGALGIGLTAYARQYLREEGGKYGSTATRRQLYDIARDLDRSGEFSKLE